MHEPTDARARAAPASALEAADKPWLYWPHLSSMACANHVTSAKTIIKGVTLTATVLAFLSVAACAKKTPTPGAAAGSAAAQQAGANIDPTTPVGGGTLTKELAGHRRSVYSSHTAKYEYFIGGELLAEYDPDSRVLVITGHGPAEGVVCKYTAEGALFVDPQNPAGKNAEVSGCNVLVTQLYRTCSVDLPPPRRGICFPLCHDLRLALFAPLLHRADDGVNRSALPLLHAAAVAPSQTQHQEKNNKHTTTQQHKKTATQTPERAPAR